MENQGSDIFVLADDEGRLLPPIQQASLLAKYSRCRESARELLKRIDETKDEAFQQKYVVEYGHNSVAELCNLPICLEGVSIIATKFLETPQRPGYSEKSTRMQDFGAESVYWPREITSSQRAVLEPLIREGFDLYNRATAALPSYFRSMGSPNDKDAERKTFDAARYLLPAGIKTNMSMNAFPRDIAVLCSSLLGHRLSEFRDIGAQLQSAAEKFGGPLIRHVKTDNWSDRWVVKEADGLSTLAEQSSTSCYSSYVNLPSVTLRFNQFPNEITDRFWILAQLQYSMSKEEFAKAMDERPEHAEVPGVFRKFRAGVSLFIDYGAFRDLQRHRRCEQFVEPLTVKYGYQIPEGLPEEWRFLFDGYFRRCASVIETMHSHDLDVFNAQYFIPLGFIHHCHFDMDLAELYYIIELRTQPRGHISYRRAVYEMFRQASNELPDLMRWCKAIQP